MKVREVKIKREREKEREREREREKNYFIKQLLFMDDMDRFEKKRNEENKTNEKHFMTG